VIKLSLANTDAPLNVLCVGAHSDDIEIGCGATIRGLLQSGRSVNAYWLVLTATDQRASEARSSASRFLEGAASVAIDVQKFRNGYFPQVAGDIKDYFEYLKGEVSPDVIFTHYSHDLHQDHRVASELTWNTFRDNWILEYEIPKYDGGLGSPALFVPATEETVAFKCDTLIECFESQKHRQWFDQSTFRALMRLRGVECNSDSGFAEGFYVRKTVSDLA
jgi:LmbE family N-acetylglucosaminyl deacetylase